MSEELSSTGTGRLRDGRIVNLRALAILLVVFGHSIILYENTWNIYTTKNSVPLLNAIKVWINLIQMPLFFNLSGYLFYFSYPRTNLKKLLKKKAVRLLIPYAAAALLWMIPIRLLIGYPGYQGKSIFKIVAECIFLGIDCGHLWFLPCLFACFLAAYIVLQVLEKLKLLEKWKFIVLFAVACGAGGLMSVFPAFPGASIARAISANWIWFCFGLMFCHYREKIRVLEKHRFLGFLCAAVCSAASLLGVMPLNGITSLVILTVLYLLAPEKTNACTDFLNKNSFGIYLIHSPLVYLTFSQFPDSAPILVVLLNFVGFGSLAATLTVLLRKTRWKIAIGE